jgi:peptidoglycan hydrolase-like protein with peptidoglycan-binding domain
MQKFFIFLFIFFILLTSLGTPAFSFQQDNINGIYTDDFSDGSGIATYSNAGVDTESGSIKLKNSSDGSFNPPFYTTGSIITNYIYPQPVSGLKKLTLDTEIPSGTHVFVSLLGLSGSYLSFLLDSSSNGNVEIDVSPTPPDLGMSRDGSAKSGAYSVLIGLITNNVNITPSVKSMSLTWTPKSGDLTPHPISSGSWSGPEGDKKNTRHSNGHIDYPTIKWVKNNYGQEPQTIINYHYGNATSSIPIENVTEPSVISAVRGSGDVIYVKDMGGSFDDGVNLSTLYAFNRKTGQQIWRRYVSGYSFSASSLTISGNESLYLEDGFNDKLYTWDGLTGALKWMYNWFGGHDSEYVNIGDDGSIYLMRRTGGDSSVTIIAMNPDGTVKWGSNPFSTSIRSATRNSAIGSDGTLYFGFSNYTDGPLDNTGKLYALYPLDGSTLWSYDTGDIGTVSPVFDSAMDVVYVANSENTQNEKKIYAINSDGTLKWSRSIGVSTDYWNSLSLRSDNVLLAERVTAAYPTPGGSIEGISTVDGSLLFSIPISTNNTAWISNVISDSQNGVLFRTTVYQGKTSIDYYDKNQVKKWSLSRNTGDYAFLANSMVDEDGNIYSFYTNNTQGYLKFFAMSELSLSGSVEFDQSNAVFTAQTTMPPTNLLTGEDNKVQIYFNNGEKIPLIFVSSDGNGNYVWSGSFPIPVGGIPSYKVEVSQAGFETDVVTHFDSPAVDSNNTGYSVQGLMPIPTLTSISPTTTTMNSPQFTLTTTGTNFVSDSTINWNGTALSTTYVSDTQLIAIVPSTNILSPDTVDITVTNSTPGGGTTDPITFTIKSSYNSGGGSYVPPKPTVTFPTQQNTNTTKTTKSTIIPACTITKTLKQGNKGEEVKCLQNKLNLIEDGIFGKLTKQSVITFQKNHNLTPDGVVGKRTRAVISAN